MLERIREFRAALLTRDAYLAEYWREYARAEGVMWKLERGQEFREPGDGSWEAFAAGDWHRSLELNEADRSEAEAIAAKDREVGVETRRIRVVEKPVRPYVQWEMQFLRLLAESGQDLRVLHVSDIAHLETRGPLPEIVILGGNVLYLVRYDAEGTPCGAWRVDDRAVIADCSAEISELFVRGEPLLEFFHREIANLPPPVPA